MSQNNIELNKYIEQWIDYPWYKGESPEYLVDESVLNSIYDRGLPFAKCIGIIDDYLILKTKTETFSVRYWDKMKIMSPSKFMWGDKVREVERPEVQGEIDNIIWHDKDAEYKYFITINGKPKSRRYNYNELVAL